MRSHGNRLLLPDNNSSVAAMTRPRNNKLLFLQKGGMICHEEMEPARWAWER